MTSPQLSDQERQDAVVDTAELQRLQTQRNQALVAQADEEDAVVAALSRRASVRRTTTPIGVIKLSGVEVPLTEEEPPYKPILDEKGQIQWVPFRYRVRPPEREERVEIDKRNTRKVPDPQLGRAVLRDETDTVQSERELLYTCTVPEDKKRFWDNTKLQAAYGAGDGIDLVGKLHNDRQQAEAILVLYAIGGGVEDERTRLKG